MKRKKRLFYIKGYTFIEMILVMVLIPILAFAVYRTFNNCINLVGRLGFGGEDFFSHMGNGNLADGFLQIRQDLENSKYFTKIFGFFKFALFRDSNSENDQTILVFQTLLPKKVEDKQTYQKVPGFVVYIFQHPKQDDIAGNQVMARFYLYYNEMFSFSEALLMSRARMLICAKNYYVEYYYFDKTQAEYRWAKRQENQEEGFVDVDPVALRITVEFSDQNVTSTFWRRTSEDDLSHY